MLIINIFRWVFAILSIIFFTVYIYEKVRENKKRPVFIILSMILGCAFLVLAFLYNWNAYVNTGIAIYIFLMFTIYGIIKDKMIYMAAGTLITICCIITGFVFDFIKNSENIIIPETTIIGELQYGGNLYGYDLSKGFIYDDGSRLGSESYICFFKSDDEKTDYCVLPADNTIINYVEEGQIPHIEKVVTKTYIKYKNEKAKNQIEEQTIYKLYIPK